MALSLPRGVRERVEAVAGARVGRVTAVGGGCISQAARVSTGAGDLFVKWHDAPPPGLFRAEATGLSRLADAGGVRVPGVLGFSDSPGAACIVMEWIDHAPGPRDAALADAGRGLASLHAARGRPPGLDVDTLIGTLPQANSPVAGAGWLDFFRQRRLAPLADSLPSATRRRLDALPLEALLDEPDGGCALLHGDLWSGNFIASSGGRGYLVDPAVYAGHPEVDLAMTRLFGGFGEPFEAAYREVSGPWPPGFDDRAALLNLYPLLVHVRLFGGAYVAQVDSTLRRFT
ncbi:MAG: fructosamine kinase family protein [Myxococcota bacterium]